MHLSDKAIEDFRVAYRSAYGEDVTREEAEILASRVLEVVYLLVRRGRRTTTPAAQAEP